jgi:hypothetical protein
MSSLSLSTTLGDFSIKLAKRHLTLNALVITMLTCASVLLNRRSFPILLWWNVLFGNRRTSLWCSLNSSSVPS